MSASGPHAARPVMLLDGCVVLPIHHTADLTAQLPPTPWNNTPAGPHLTLAESLVLALRMRNSTAGSSAILERKG
jgi:hypothetical protein